MAVEIVGQSKRTTYQGCFTGPVELEMLVAADAAERPDVARVHFEERAVTNWHRHPGGQILYLLDGEGRVGCENEGVAVAVGDLVVTPAGERHWHGAGPGGPAVFLTMTWGTTQWEDSAPG